MPPYDAGTGRPPDFQPLTSAEIQDVVALRVVLRDEGQRGHRRLGMSELEGADVRGRVSALRELRLRLARP